LEGGKIINPLLSLFTFNFWKKNNERKINYPPSGKQKNLEKKFVGPVIAQTSRGPRR